MTTRSKLYFPLGFPVRLSANSKAVMAAADEAWSDWQPLFDVEPAAVAVDVQAGFAARTSEPAFAGTAGGFRFSDGGSNFAEGDWLHRTIAMRISGHTVRDLAYFRYYYLEAAVNQLVSGLHFTPIHAACMSPPSQGGILLCGDSGAGKSSLAFAGARRGWTYTTDDASFLIRDGGVRVVGDAHRMRMRPESASLFPELAQYPATQRGNGDVRLQLRPRECGIETATTANIRRAVLLLREGSGGAKLSAWDRASAEEWFGRVFYRWAPEIGRGQARALSHLLDRIRLEQLTYSRLPDAVLALEA